ncbi:helix-turn-helix domain-containing protein [Bradyrhizobium sp. 2TAF24]|uniref:helix-turn-helix domain-containing protein n=1 Tax=Bradyrhizobium sp. 2TAF24 TaxID=3233011 RepID=UPI003F903288
MLPHSVLDTTGLSVREATAAWQESIGVMFDTRLRHAPDNGFRAEVEGFQFGELLLGSCRTAAQTFDRSPRRISRDNLDHVLLQFYTEGSCGRRDGGLDERTQPGDLWISDLAQPQAVAATDFRNLNLVVPRRLLTPLLNAPDEHNMRVLSGASPLVRLLYSHLQALFQSGSQLTLQDADALLQPTLQLAAAAINGNAREESRQGVVSSLFGAIARHIELHIADPALSVDSVAAVFGISRRKLYYLFEPWDGFASYVQKQRLQACRRALADPAQRHRTVAEIAEAHGFTHPKSFSRAFRRHIGMTAREVRSLASEGDNLSAPWMATEEWWSWIRQLR